MEEALKRMVMVATEAKAMADFMALRGFADSPYEKIFGHIADAIFYLIGEDKNNYDSFEQSYTYKILNCDHTDSVKALSLWRAYQDGIL